MTSAAAKEVRAAMLESADLSFFEQWISIKVCGIGPAGMHALSQITEDGLRHTDYVAVGVDDSVLSCSPAPVRLAIPCDSGLDPRGDSGSDRVAERTLELSGDLRRAFARADVVFILADLGEAVGAGAAPAVGAVAGEVEALTIALVILPPLSEGPAIVGRALKALELLEQRADSVVLIPRARAAAMPEEAYPFSESPHDPLRALRIGVRSITTLITENGIIRIDFADLRTIFERNRRVLMGFGGAGGDDGALRATQSAIDCPLLGRSLLSAARACLFDLRGTSDLSMRDASGALDLVRDAVTRDCILIYGVDANSADTGWSHGTIFAAGMPVDVLSLLTG